MEPCILASCDNRTVEQKDFYHCHCIAVYSEVWFPVVTNSIPGRWPCQVYVCYGWWRGESCSTRVHFVEWPYWRLIWPPSRRTSQCVYVTGNYTAKTQSQVYSISTCSLISVFWYMSTLWRCPLNNLYMCVWSRADFMFCFVWALTLTLLPYPLHEHLQAHGTCLEIQISMEFTYYTNMHVCIFTFLAAFVLCTYVPMYMYMYMPCFPSWSWSYWNSNWSLPDETLQVYSLWSHCLDTVSACMCMHMWSN